MCVRSRPRAAPYELDLEERSSSSAPFQAVHPSEELAPEHLQQHRRPRPSPCAVVEPRQTSSCATPLLLLPFPSSFPPRPPPPPPLSCPGLPLSPGTGATGALPWLPRAFSCLDPAPSSAPDGVCTATRLHPRGRRCRCLPASSALYAPRHRRFHASRARRLRLQPSATYRTSSRNLHGQPELAVAVVQARPCRIWVPASPPDRPDLLCASSPSRRSPSAVGLCSLCIKQRSSLVPHRPPMLPLAWAASAPKPPCLGRLLARSAGPIFGYVPEL